MILPQHLCALDRERCLGTTRGARCVDGHTRPGPTAGRPAYAGAATHDHPRWHATGGGGQGEYMVNGTGAVFCYSL